MEDNQQAFSIPSVGRRIPRPTFPSLRARLEPARLYLSELEMFRRVCNTNSMVRQVQPIPFRLWVPNTPPLIPIKVAGADDDHSVTDEPNIHPVDSAGSPDLA